MRAALHLGVAPGNRAQELFAIALECEKMGIAPRRFVRRIGRKPEGHQRLLDEAVALVVKDLADFENAYGRSVLREIFDDSRNKRGAQKTLFVGERISNLDGAGNAQRLGDNLAVPQPFQGSRDAALQCERGARNFVRGHRWNDGGNSFVTFDPCDLFDQVGRNGQVATPRRRNNGQNLRLNAIDLATQRGEVTLDLLRGSDRPRRRCTSATLSAIAAARVTGPPKA